MKIIVDGKQAVLKKGSSFEYHSENPLFTEAEDYSFDIEFPMEDCPQNIAIFGALHVKGVDISTVSFPCEIITESFDKSGILTIISVSNAEVKGQFLEGMSQQNFDSSLSQTYLTDLDFSAYDGTDGTTSSYNEVMGPNWENVNIYNSKKDNILKYDESAPGAADIYHRYIHLKRLIEIIGLVSNWEIDCTCLNEIPFWEQIVVVNARISSGEDMFRALKYSMPHWTIKEFISNLCKFFGCIYFVDDINRKITIKPASEVCGINEDGESIEVLDEFEVDVIDEDTSNWFGNRKYKLPDESNPDRVNSCQGYFELCQHFGVYRQNLSLSDFENNANKGANGGIGTGQFGNDEYSILHITDYNNNAVVVSSEEYHSDNLGRDYVFQIAEVLNQYGCDTDGEELGISPCNLVYKKASSPLSQIPFQRLPSIEIPDDPWRMVYLDAPEYKASEVIKDGEIKEEDSYYKHLWLVLYQGNLSTEAFDGQRLYTRKYEAPRMYNTVDGKEKWYTYFIETNQYRNTLTPKAIQIQEYRKVPVVDESKVYRYKILSSTLPDVKKIFKIKGRKFVCAKLTAHFKEDGLSEYIEGEFYEVIS